MHPFFEPLSDREAMLLLTTLTVGTRDDTTLFRYMSEEAASRLQQKAEALFAIPSEKRVPFMVHEIKQALAYKGLRGVERVDPSWIIHKLKGESPRVIAAILITLPPQTVRSIIKRLPSALREKLPPKDEVKNIPKDLQNAVREIFEARFAPMPPVSAKGFYYRDVLQLERPEIQKLLRDLGLVELAQAFVSVGKNALAELCRRLPREHAEELVLAVRSASRVDSPDPKSAQRFLSKIVPNFSDTEEFFLKSGVWRLAKATLLEADNVRIGFKQRLPKEMGELFASYLEKAQEIEPLDETALKRIQDSVLLRIRDLSRKNVLGPRWKDLEMGFHNAPAPETSQSKVAPSPMDP